MDDIQILITPDETRMIKFMARKIYRQYCPAGERGSLTVDDLYHYGIAGLLEARRNYDPDKGFSRLAFSTSRVSGAMLDAVRKLPMVRLPQEQQDKVKQLRQTREDLILAGPDPDPVALAKKLGWPVTTVHRINCLANHTLATCCPDNDDDALAGGPTGMQLAATGADPEKRALKKELADLIQRCLAALSATSRLVLQTRIFKELKLREVAATMNCSTETVRLKQQQATNRIKGCLEKNGWPLEDWYQIFL